MTVSSQQSYVEYNADGSTTTFTVPFYFLLGSDLAVTVEAADGTTTDLAYGVNFSVTGAGNASGGTITTNVTYPTGSTILILRSPPATQETAYAENGKFPAKSHEKALDKLTMLVQRWNYWWDNLALKRPNFFSTYYDAKNFKISNLASPVASTDAANKQYVNDGDNAEAAARIAGDNALLQTINQRNNRALRVPESSIPEIASSTIRSGLFLGFNDQGNPVPLSIQTGTADLAVKLASTTGTGLIGVKTSELTLDKLLSADDMAIEYGYVNSTVSERLARTGAKVVLVGDSLSSFFNIDSVNTASIFESYLRRKIREYNSSIKFINRAIGGMRYYDLGRDEPPLSAVTPSYPWYTDTSKRWMTYLDDLKPDVIFIAFGMNDGSGWDVGNFQQPVFFKMMDELKTISSSPEIVFCTNILPSTTNPTTSPEDQQMGRDAMAGWTRSFARKYGYSYLDLHRRFKCIRDGSDPCMSSYARATVRKVVTLPYVHPVKCGMYAARVTLIDPAVASAGITFRLSSLTNSFILLRYDSGRWQSTVYTGTTASSGISDQASVSGPAPAADTEIYFTLNGDVAVITIGINTYPVFNRNVVRFGGAFSPEIGGSGDIRIDLIEGTPIPVKSELNDYDVYNTDGDGGNGLNHPTAKASSRIYSRVVDEWFGKLSGAVPARKQSIDLDFINGTVSVRNPFSPEVSGESKISSALTFINGSLTYQRDSQGRVMGAIFGATNRAYIDQALFNTYTGSYNRLDFEVEFISPGSQAYLFSLGENTSTDRVIAQVTSDIRPRATISVSSVASDMIGSSSFPYIAGKKYTLNFSIDCAETYARIWGGNNSSRGNIVATAVANISAATLSKLKLGYVSAGTFAGDVVISRVKVWFGS